MTDLTPNDLSPQGEHAPGPEPLSPTAEAIFFAADGMQPRQYRGRALAAAIRALADQVVPERLLCTRTAEELTLYHEGRLDAAIRFRAEILAIATELEGQ